MIVKFGEDTDFATVAAVLGDLSEWVVNLDHENKGYPHEAVMILGVSRDGFSEIVTVCEVDKGTPVRNSTWDVPVDGLSSITIL